MARQEHRSEGIGGLQVEVQDQQRIGLSGALNVLQALAQAGGDTGAAGHVDHLLLEARRSGETRCSRRVTTTNGTGTGAGAAKANGGGCETRLYINGEKNRRRMGKGAKKRIGDVISRWELRSKEEEQQEEGRMF